MILSGLFTALFGALFGRWRAAFITLLCIAFYTLLVRAGASAVRAALMGGIALFAVQLGRRGAGLNTLAFVAALMALVNPFVLWDVGFQLSFLATLGLVLYAASLSAAFTRLAGRYLPEQSARRLSKPAGEYFLFTLAAMLTTLGLHPAAYRPQQMDRADYRRGAGVGRGRQSLSERGRLSRPLSVRLAAARTDSNQGLCTTSFAST